MLALVGNNRKDVDMERSLLDIYNKISIQQYKTDMGFKALVEGVHDNLFVIPEYQRKYRWSKEQVEELAASLIRDLPIPPIYTYRNKDGQLEILDGQQRVMSLYFYYKGMFFKNAKNSVFDYSDLDVDRSTNFEDALKSKYRNIVTTKFYMTLDGEKYDISYDELPIALKRKIDYRAISVIEIKIESEVDKSATLHKIFTNLNNGGSELSNQELRNGVYPCDFSRMINNLNKKNEKWRALYGRIDSVCQDMELLYRFCALKTAVDYDGSDFQITGFKTMDKLIDEFSKKAFSFSQDVIEEYRVTLEQFIDVLSISKVFFKKKLLLEGLFIVWVKGLIHGDQLTDDICSRLLADQTINQTCVGRTNSVSNMNKRWKRIYELISEYDK